MTNDDRRAVKKSIQSMSLEYEDIHVKWMGDKIVINYDCSLNLSAVPSLLDALQRIWREQARNDER